MATSKGQRIGIWIIAAFMLVGTLGGFIGLMLPTSSDPNQIANEQKQAEFQKALAEYQAKVDEQNAELSKKYYPVLSQYTGEVGKFNADEVKTLSTNDLKQGDGEEIKDGTKYSAYYIGWNPEGKIFDQSIDNGKLKSPIPGEGLIKGWMEGVKGMKINGVRVLTIPADQAYGDKGAGDLIPPHTPIKFVVLAVPTPPAVPVPDILMQMQQ